MQRLIEAYQQEIMTRQELSTRREQIAQRLKGVAQDKANLEPQRDTTIQWERIADHIHQFRALRGSHLDRLRYEDRQAVVQLLVEQVVVYPEGAVEVHHVLPFEEQPVAADQKKKVPQVNVMSGDCNSSTSQRSVWPWTTSSVRQLRSEAIRER